MKDKEGKKGFTLVELLVSFFMFVIVIGGMTSSLLKAVKVQQRMVANQKMLSEANFLMDRMVRELKLAQRDDSGGSNPPYYLLGPAGGSISFRSSTIEGPQKFNFANSSIEEGFTSPKVQISSNKVEITQLTFSSAESDWGSAEGHPRVAISMTIKSKETGDEITVQTVVSPLKKDVSLPQD